MQSFFNNYILIVYIDDHEKTTIFNSTNFTELPIFKIV